MIVKLRLKLDDGIKSVWFSCSSAELPSGTSGRIKFFGVPKDRDGVCIVDSFREIDAIGLFSVKEYAVLVGDEFLDLEIDCGDVHDMRFENDYE